MAYSSYGAGAIVSEIAIRDTSEGHTSVGAVLLILWMI
jgi:hypothetical protein